MGAAAGDLAHDPSALRGGEGRGVGVDRADGELLSRSVTEARRLAAVASRSARGRGAKPKRKAAADLKLEWPGFKDT
jgi:hypothetical protein